jgi:hypothetical protein
VAAVAANTADDQLKPEMLIRFPASAPVCLTREDLFELMGHGVRQEVTKYNAMFVGHGESAPCMMVSPKLTLKVLSVEYNDPNIDIGLVEVIGNGTDGSEGAWAMTVGAERVVGAAESKPKGR